jgi:hypothetical protein
MTPPEAVQALLRIERGHIPATLWDPCCGTGNIVTELQQAGFRVCASDVADYGFPCRIEDYLEAAPPIGVAGIITNPPFGQALKFVKKSLKPRASVEPIGRPCSARSVAHRWSVSSTPKTFQAHEHGRFASAPNTQMRDQI